MEIVCDKHDERDEIIFRTSNKVGKIENIFISKFFFNNSFC